jgi:hypothetical protein
MRFNGRKISLVTHETTFLYPIKPAEEIKRERVNHQKRKGKISLQPPSLGVFRGCAIDTGCN